MTAVLALLWKLLATPRGLAGLGFAAVLTFAGVEAARAHHLAAQLTAARAALIDPATHAPWRTEALDDLRDLTTARQNLTTLGAALDKQQAAVAALAAQGVADTAHARQALQASAARAAVSTADAAKILATKPAGDPCVAADQLILESLR